MATGTYFEHRWELQWHAMWGLCLVARLGMIGAFSDRRDEERNPSSAS